MTEEVREVLSALSDVMCVNFFDEDETSYQAACGIGNLFDTKKECQVACDKWNRLAKVMGWKEYSVYIMEKENLYKPNEEKFVCSTEEQAKVWHYEKA